MIEYINSFLFLTLLGTIYYIYYKYKIFFRALHIVMDSIILNQLSNLEEEVGSEVIQTRKGRKKKTGIKMLPTINEGEKNDIRDKRKSLVACVLFGNSKQYLGKNTLNRKLMKWIAITLISYQIDMNTF